MLRKEDSSLVVGIMASVRDAVEFAVASDCAIIFCGAVGFAGSPHVCVVGDGWAVAVSVPLRASSSFSLALVLDPRWEVEGLGRCTCLLRFRACSCCEVDPSRMSMCLVEGVGSAALGALGWTIVR